MDTRAKGASLVQTRPTGHGRARGLTSPRDVEGRIHAATYAPPEDLSDIVSSLWSASWDFRGVAPHETQLLSDPCVHLVCESEGPHAGSRVVGVWTRLWRRPLEGRAHVRGIKLRAGAAGAVLPPPIVALSNRISPLRGYFVDAEVQIGALEAEVIGAQSDAQAFAVFCDWLREKRNARRPDSASVQTAVELVDQIVARPEILSVEALAQLADMTPRAIQRLFRQHVGATPKWVIRQNRLQEVALRIERGLDSKLAELAADLGYSDQAHLARDFKRAVGKTPRQFARSVRG